MSEQIELANFKFNVDEVVQNAQKLKEAIDKVKTEQTLLKLQGDQSSEAYVKTQAKLKALNAEYGQHIKVIQTSVNTTADTVNRSQLLGIALSQEATSIKDVREQNKLLNKLRNETNVTTAQGQEELQKLNQKLDENFKFVKQNGDEYLKQKLNIGNYESALRNVSPRLSGIVTQLKGYYSALVVAKEAIIAQTVATDASSRSLKVFKLALISTGIGAIVVALGTLITYLSTTQAGIDKVTSVLRPLTAIFKSLIGVLQQVGEFMFNAFANPKEALEDIYNYVKDKIIVQFKSFGKILEGIFTLDFSKVKEGFNDLANNAKGVLNDIAGVGKSVGKFFDDAIKKGQQIDQLTKANERAQNDFILLQAESNRQIKELELLSKDKSKTDAERNAAVQEAIRLSEELAQSEQVILDRKIQIKEIENSLNDTSRKDIEELNKLKAERISKDEEADKTKLRFLGVENELRNEANANAQKAVDAAIVKQKQLLDLYVAQQGTRARTLEDQLTIEQAISDKKLAILNKELKAKKITQEDYNKQSLEISNSLGQKQAELAVDNASRELEIYRDLIDKKLETNQFLSDEVAKQQQADNDAYLQKQIAFEALRLEQGVINQQEFDDAIRDVKEANRIANNEIDKKRESVAREEAKALREIDFENELQRLISEGASRLEIEQAQAQEQYNQQKSALDQSLKDQKISQDVYKKSIALLDKKYKYDEVARERILAQQKLDVIGNTLGQVSKLLGESTAAGKAAGIAQAVINTWRGVSEVWAAKPESGLVGAGFLQKVVTSAATLASGLQTVKKIANVSTSVSGTASMGDASSAISQPQGLGSSLANISGQNVNLSSISASGNAAVQNQLEDRSALGGLSDTVADAVERGALAGTERGSQEGITNLSENRRIQQSSAF